MYDMEEYQNHIRNFYLEPEELPGPVLCTEKELYNALRSMPYGEAYDEKYRRFHEKYNCLDGPHTSRKVVNWMLQQRIKE